MVTGHRGRPTDSGRVPPATEPAEQPTPQPVVAVAAGGHALRHHRQVHTVEAVEEHIHKGLVKAP